MSPGRTSASRAHGLALALALLFGAQAWWAGLDESVTWDEPGYVAAGYLNWTQGDYRLNEDHPPGLQKLVALPLLFLDIDAPDLDSVVDWERNGNPRATYGFQLFFRSENDPVTLTRASRMPVVALGMALVLLVYGLVRELAGPAAGLLAAALVALDPNLLAHGRLATEDLGCATGMVAAVWTWWRWLRAASLGRAIACGIATAFALLAKYTALLLLPIDAILLTIAWATRASDARPVALGRGLVVIAGVSLLLVNFAYGAGFFLDRYAIGVTKIYPEFSPDYHFYFFGHVSDEPFWYYAIASLAIKTPLPVWGLLALAVAAVARSKPARASASVLLVPAFVVLLASCFDATSPGARRVLPALPFLLGFAGLAIDPTLGRRVAWVAWALVFLSATVAMRTFPHHLSYLNAAFGGADRGPYLLDESNIDWGQDLPALARWQREHLPDQPLQLLYFGNADPAAYGVNAVGLDIERLEDPAPGVAAVSAHYLAFFRKLQAVSGRDTDWLTKYQPVGKAGAIHLYRFPAREPPAGRSAPPR